MKKQTREIIERVYHHQRKRIITITIILCIILCILMALSMMLGNTFYSLNTVIQSLLYENIPGASFTVNTLRFPRMLAGVFCGIAFGMAGNTFQKMLGNPLASPDIIGVTSGASTVAVFCILILHWSGNAVSIGAILGGMLVAFLIYRLSQGIGSNNGRMILIGLGFQAFLQAVISYIILRAAQYDVANALRWLSGSLNNVTIEEAVRIVIVVIFMGSSLVYLSRRLMLLQLGEDFATTLGLNIQRTKLLLIVNAIILSAVATSISGPIAAVSFLSGPTITRICKGNQANMLQAGLMGAILVLAGDLVAQNLLPARYPVGIITGILGAPYLLLMLFRMNHKGG